ncbi:MAG: 3-deoxy-7-phosphoheptulonate synthase, partial [Acidimicrobiia bacterium]|nr:3-deoxy-7-phosphoheptulonate synthase [Acidimicrobiia bacterium]
MSPAKGDESMIIVMKPDAVTGDVDNVVERLAEIGAEAHVSVGQVQTVVGAIGD